MSLKNINKTNIIKIFGKNLNDTGSPEVQIAILSAMIENLQQHLENNPKDLHSKQGLRQKLSLRKRLIQYLNRINPESLSKIVGELKIRTSFLNR